MNYLIIGNGGREHAILKALVKNDNNNKYYYYGEYNNPGMTKDAQRIEKLDIDILKKLDINIIIIGPEKYLKDGIIDIYEPLGYKCIGPKKILAQIETSKIFAREFMTKYDMSEYSPKYKIFDNNCQNKDYIDFINELNNNYVIKADGLHEGKGVKISEEDFSNIEDALQYCNEIKDNDENFLIEEKLYGNEFSLMSFTDGVTCKHMPIVQDYKRLFNNNKGPNTGGMGSVSYENHSLPFLDEKDIKICQKINENIINNLYKEFNERYKGILYGNFIKTDKDEIKVIELNARFGNPECINILEILDTDLSIIFDHILDENLDKLDIKYKNMATYCLYFVPHGYPKNPIKNHEIYIDNKCNFNNIIYGSLSFKIEDEEFYLYELGSRTLAIISSNDNLLKASQDVLNQINYINGPLFCRTDIGIYQKNNIQDNIQDLKQDSVQDLKQDLKQDVIQDSIQDMKEDMKQDKIEDVKQDMKEDEKEDKKEEYKITYEKCGVNIEEGNKVINQIRKHIESTFNKNVISDFGDFAGMYQINDDQVLVTSVDGVGTKSILVLEKYGYKKGYEMLGHDLVNHCVNDILVKGAKPLFFLDYYASSKISANYVEYFVKGLSDACKEADCVLIGGETAEMPDTYLRDRCDLVGTIVGIVDKKNIINGKDNIKNGDLIIGFPSSGPHTNGYSLIRKIVNENTSQEMIDALCATHRCYYPNIMKMIEDNIEIHGLCHITGGGWVDNPIRVVPQHLMMNFSKFEISDVFSYIQEKSNIDEEKMLTLFNCGIGMIAIIKETNETLKMDNIIGKIINSI